MKNLRKSAEVSNHAATRPIKRKRAHWRERILDLLGHGPATTRMMAMKFGCQSSDLTRAVEGLRAAGVIVQAHTELDPGSGCQARFWRLVNARSAESVDKAA